MEIDQIRDRISFLLARICHAHRSNIHARLSTLDLHVGQEMFLLNLSENEGVTQSELADCLCVQQATVTRMLDRMTKSGFVERRKDEADQRVSRVFLTDAGRVLLEPIATMWEEVEEEMMKNFTLEERLLFRRLLLQVYDNLYS